MAEKGAKKKKGKAEANVLASLPKTRPSKLGRRGRDGAPTTTEAATSARAKPTAKKASNAAAKAAKKRPAAKARPKPGPVATVAEAKPNRPKPVRSASKNLAKPAAKSADKRGPALEKRTAPSGTELVTTVVQAASELASVGLSIGGQIVKRAVERLPKP